MERVTQPIVGGTMARAGDFPGVVAIFVNGREVCTGVLITPKIVLSAARCFDSANGGPADLQAVSNATSVYVGSTDLNTITGSGVPVATIRLHPSYAMPFKSNDLSLVALRSNATSTPAAINADSALLPGNTSLTLVGYGVSRAPNGTPDQTSSGVLFSVASSTKSCAAIAIDVATTLCFDQSNGKGACGDTGGPSYLDVNGTPVVAGVHSYNDPNCNQYSLDSRVDKELSFIGPTLCASDGFCATGCGANSLGIDPDCAPTEDAGTAHDASTSPGGHGGGAFASGGSAGMGNSGVSGTSSAGSGGTSSAGSGSMAAAAPGGMTSGPDTRITPPAAERSGNGCGCRLAPDGSLTGRGLPTALTFALCFGLPSRRRRRRP
jgi:hypothetical protein